MGNLYQRDWPRRSRYWLAVYCQPSGSCSALVQASLRGPATRQRENSEVLPNFVVPFTVSIFVAVTVTNSPGFRTMSMGFLKKYWLPFPSSVMVWEVRYIAP